MKKEIIINCNLRENRVAVLTDGKLEQFFLQREEKQRPLGNIYKGKVTTILPGLGAAFVNIGLEKDGFLPMGETAQSSSLWEDVIEDEDAPTPPDTAFHHLLQEKLEDVLSTLTPREARILRLRFGQNGRSYTLEEVGKKFGIPLEYDKKADRKSWKEMKKFFKNVLN